MSYPICELVHQLELAIPHQFDPVKETCSEVSKSLFPLYYDIFTLLMIFHCEVLHHRMQSLVEEPCLSKEDFLPKFNISLKHFGTTFLEFIPPHHLLEGYLSLDEVSFTFEFFNLTCFIGLNIVTIEQLNISDFVNFRRELDILLDVVDPQVVFFVLKLFIQLLSNFMSFLAIQLIIFVKSLFTRQI